MRDLLLSLMDRALARAGLVRQIKLITFMARCLEFSDALSKRTIAVQDEHLAQLSEDNNKLRGEVQRVWEDRNRLWDEAHALKAKIGGTWVSTPPS